MRAPRLLKNSLLTLLYAASITHARTWTSADGNSQFEGDFVSAADGNVTVLRDGRRQTFALTLLSDTDRTWIAEQATTPTEKVTISPDIEKGLAKLRKVSGSRLSRYKLESTPQYFVLYYSASW